VKQCLDDDFLSKVSNIVLNLLSSKYTVLKDTLKVSRIVLKRNCENELGLGDRRPSQLFYRMRDFAQTGVLEKVFKSL